MNLNTDKWKDFFVGEIFDCQTTKAVDINYVTKGNIPYITRSATNNGFSGLIGNDEHINNGNCITIGAEGKKAFYQPVEFVAGVKVYTLRNENLNCFNALFVVTLLNRLEYIYSYGRARVLEKIKREIIKLPSTNSGEVDWNYMEEYIKSLHSKAITTDVKQIKSEVDVESFSNYMVKDLFEVKYGINMELVNCRICDKDEPNSVNFVARTSNNNGVVARVKIEDGCTPQLAGTITCAGGGSVLSTFIQNDDFYSGRDLYLLLPKSEMSIYTKMFICTVLQANKYKYNYGRQANKTLPYLKLKLPSKSDGTPDFEYMENYIKSLQYSDRI